MNARVLLWLLAGLFIALLAIIQFIPGSEPRPAQPAGPPAGEETAPDLPR